MAELVVKRYATALFDVATTENKVKQYEEEVADILKALRDTPDFVAVLHNQKVTLEEKVALVEKVFSNQVDGPIVGLLVLLVKKNRQRFLVQVLEAFLEMVKKQAGIIKATVTSAVQLTESQVDTIKVKLEASTNSKIELETIIDTSIIAGLIIRVGDKVVDASIRGKMQTLKKQLSELRLA
ncbi:ATP synthase F1 subunit delta [Sporanaerobium hydrogeniformans]|uniref:ATP synthase F1 subunit delta n=1 Tax=Sporanaerobium hydrogeniformans TaxID=3072179 RepID=A0AC61D9C0_9FIRM|nr:ATP synthase F1 subunit delta [Sporanaerobium hydrogeniformans]PHV69859.1 ATP synthase F1 subunit delta [Sporanaerobium hydrogeniformans]